jgi:hypothetical protein
MKLPAKLDQGLVDPETMDLTPILVRQVRSRLEGMELPCGFPGCTCDPNYEPYECFDTTAS